MNSLVEKMYEYQRKHGIKGECLANTQYLYDSVNASIPGINAKAFAVIAYRQIHKEHGIKDRKRHIEVQHHLITHMVLQIGDSKLIDPSAEVADMDNIQYVGSNICNLLKKLRMEGLSESEIKDGLKQYLLFKSYAERMNSGELLVANKVYYNNQADHIQRCSNAPMLQAYLQTSTCRNNIL
jgi:hypothetical protein